MKLDRQIEHLPTEVKFCKRCVVSNQRPRITFDDEGVCSACRYAETKWLPEHAGGTIWAERKHELRALLEKYRRSDGSYDCIVPASGGKDSGAVAHKLKTEYGMHPLTVTFAPYDYTSIGRHNFRSFIDAGFSNVMMNPDGEFYRQLARLCFELLGDHWQAFAWGQVAWPLMCSVKHDIPLIVYGENGEAEYGGDSSWNDVPCYPLDRMEDHINMIKAPLWDVVNVGIERGYYTRAQADAGVQPFLMPTPAEIDRVKPVYAWYSYFERWHPQENYYYSQKHTGFESNPQGRSEGTYSKYASLDDKTDGFHYWMAYIKFGIGRATADAAHEVRDGDITRDDAVSLVKRFDGEFPRRYFQEFLELLDLTNEEFWKVADSWRSPHVWQQDIHGQWALRHAVYDR